MSKDENMQPNKFSQPIGHSLTLRHLKYWVGVQQGQSDLMGRRYLFSLALVGHPSSHSVAMKMPYGADVLLH